MARIDNAYAYYISTYAQKTVSRYDSHKKSELRKVYNKIVKINKDSPLYKIPNLTDAKKYAIDIKENARSIQNVVASLSDQNGSFEDSFKKKVAMSSDDEKVSVTYIGDGSEESKTNNFDIEVQRLATPQINQGRFLKDNTLSMRPGAYSFDLNTSGAAYEFQYNINSDETNLDVLDKLAPDYPVVSKVLEYRQLTKLKSTYADGLAGYIQEDGRIHGKFHQTVTATGRLSSAEPNLQNIPVRVELGRMIRKVFVPEEGYVFVDADYSQIELRVLAHCSQDEQLIQAYREEADIHRITASQVFHIPFDEVTPLQRRNAKAVNFGIVYGISSFGLSQDLSITRKEAAKYIEDYFQTYPGIKKFLDDTVAHAKENGYVVTLFGRRRPVPELSSSNFMQRSFGERVAMNAPIQGTAADIMKIAMIGVGRKLKEEHLKSRLVLQVHDELLIEAYEPEVEEVKKILEEEMEHAADLRVPLEIDMHTGTNWYEAK